jgi:hypothetical protein
MASLPISFGDPEPKKESAGERRLQSVPRPLQTSLSVTVRLGDHLAEITAVQHCQQRRTRYSYAILTIAGERIYQSGDGFLSATCVVEKAAQHLEALWNSERY